MRNHILSVIALLPLCMVLNAQSLPSGFELGHGYVDLGLSVKWATCNVGASSPEQTGEVFAWGETVTKSEYMDRNCSTLNKKMGESSRNRIYDAAVANWGPTWLMPTKAQIEELLSNCTAQWLSYQGVKGCLLTSKVNAESIFLPASGYFVGKAPVMAGSIGCYWSGTANAGDNTSSYGLYIDEDGANSYWNNRYAGHCVRAVTR